MSTTLKTILTLAALLVIFFAVNVLAKSVAGGARLDLTEGRVFSLSDGTRSILKRVPEPISITYYFGAKAAQGNPAVQSYGQRVRELLDEFVRISGGKIRVSVVDPQPFSEQEDEAQAAGVSPVQIPGSREGATYLGVVGTNDVDGREVIPFLSPEREKFLEYELARLVYSLSNPEKKKVGLITSLPLEGGFDMDPRTQQPRQTQPWQIMAELKALVEVKRIDPATLSSGSMIDKDIEVLLLVHPKTLSDNALYAIDQFVMGGGKLLAFVDPFCEGDPAGGRDPMQRMQADKSSNIDALINAWGVEIPAGKIAADSKLAVPVNVGQRNKPDVVPVVYYLNLKRENIEQEDVATAQLGQIILGTPGFIREKAVAAVPADGQSGPPAPGTEGPRAKITPLLKTSTQSMEIDASRVSMMPDQKNLFANFAPSGKEMTLAARLSGKVRSAFPAGRPAMEPGKEAPAPDPERPHLSESKGEINAILVADADMLADAFWVQQTILGPIKQGDNGAFFVNAADNLLGSTDLIALRARGTFTRPFALVDEMERRAEADFRTQESLLQQKLRDTEQKIADLEKKRPDGADSSVMLTPEQMKEIENFRAERVKTRKELRKVQLDLRKDTEDLGTKLKFLNIGLMPVLVALFALGLGAYRVSRRGTGRRKMSKAE